MYHRIAKIVTFLAFVQINDVHICIVFMLMRKINQVPPLMQPGLVRIRSTQLVCDINVLHVCCIFMVHQQNLNVVMNRFIAL